MSDDQALYGIDFCFNATVPGNPTDGHYTLGYGFIKWDTSTNKWTKVAGDLETATKNTQFVFTVWDQSGRLSKIDFITIAFRPGGDDPANSEPSPFGSTDNKKLLDGQTLSNPASGTSTGCGFMGKAFSAGDYKLKHSGHFEMTIELRCTLNNTEMLFKCDPKIQVGP